MNFVKCVTKQTSKTVNMDIYCTPSPKIEVISNDILTLTNTTFRVTKDSSGQWLLFGEGEEAILGQLSNTTIRPEPQSCGSIITGEANFYNVDVLSNRTGAEFLNEKKYGDEFYQVRSFSVENLQYETSFKNPEPLRYIINTYVFR